MRSLIYVLALALCAGALDPRVATAAPLHAQVGRCHTVALEDPATGAVGNTAERRVIEVQFGYAASSNAAKDQELDDTETVEVCWMRINEVHCPWSEGQDADWLVYDKATGQGEAPESGNVQLLGKTLGFEPKKVPLDWDDPLTKGTILFLRVNGSGQIGLTELNDRLTQDGFCPAAHRMAGGAGDHFRVYGYDATQADPVSAFGLDPCTSGNKAQSGTFSKNACADPLAADFVFDKYNLLDDWQVERILAGTPLSPPTWQLGSGGDCGGPCPMRIFIQAMPGYSQAKSGRMYLQVTGAALTDPLKTEAVTFLGNRGHEYFHSLQQAFRRAQPVDAPALGKEPFVEGGASSAIFCLDDYDPLLPPGLCVSNSRLRTGEPNPYNFVNTYLNLPSDNFTVIPYASALFWRYALEQYASVKHAGNLAHPAGTGSAIPSNPSFPLGAVERRPDEGVDFMRRVMEQCADTPAAPILDAIDETLEEHLGRPLEPLMLDYASALVLKDYKYGDRRWHFDWMGNHNAGAAMQYFPDNPPTAVFGAVKRPVPPDLVGVGSDNYRRVRRVLDTYAPGLGAPVLKTLEAGEFEASVAPAGLSPFGSAYLSVHPAADLGMLRIRLTPEAGTPPHFRIFLVDPDGDAGLWTGCNKDPGDALGTGSCQQKEVPDGNGGTVLQVDETLAIPADGSIDEVIVVASAARQGGSFTWSFGKVEPRLVILDPLTSRRANVGHPNNPDGKRSFLVQLAVLDDDNLPMTIDPASLTLSIPGCAAASCVLDPESDYTLVPFKDGLIWATVTLPDTFYPNSPDGVGPLDLQAEAEGLAIAFEDDALFWSKSPWSVALYLVLDKSGSMNDFGGSKLAAAKIAGTALIQALSGADAVGITTFNEDAQLAFGLIPLSFNGVRDSALFALNGITAGGCTSIGDGVLEAQSFLAQNLDDVPYGLFSKRPDVQSMVVLSDGLANSGHPLYQYYSPQPFPDVFTADGKDNHASCDWDDDPSDNEPWFLAKLRYPDRLGAKLPVPLISGVAIGPDADLSELQKLAALGGGFFTYLEGPADASALQMRVATSDLSDSFRTGANAASGHERVATFRPLSIAPAHMPALTVEPGLSELLVTVTSARDNTYQLRLVAPDGMLVYPYQARVPSTVFRVPSPQPGVWTWHLALPITSGGGYPVSDGEEAVFVEQAVRGPILLFAKADVFGAFPAAGEQPAGEDGRNAGREIYVRAAPFARQPIAGATVTADVRRPDGTLLLLPLHDDGLHHDGEAGDGLYGAMLTQTQQAGVYTFRVVATGTSPLTGAPFRREKVMGVALHHGQDGDRDGLPDWWEIRHGLDPRTENERTTDTDGDGLSDVDEWRLGTHPLLSDTDGGGEADGSEIRAGRDPLDPRDDKARPFELRAVPGHAKVLLSLPQTPRGVTLEVERAPQPGGPWRAVFAGPAPTSGVVADATADGLLACYRLRTEDRGVQSAWSSPACATPALDPFAPRVDVEEIRTGRDSVVLRIEAWEAPDPGVAEGDLLDPEVRPSGLAEMRISTRADFTGARWEPYRSEVEVALSREAVAVYVQVKDVAGNESNPAIWGIPGR